MPYIKQVDRDRIELELVSGPRTAGELNYLFTAFALDYLKRLGSSYQIINDIIGALEGAKLEFYRRVVVPYEETKIKSNGDVYK